MICASIELAVKRIYSGWNIVSDKIFFASRSRTSADWPSSWAQQVATFPGSFPAFCRIVYSMLQKAGE